MARMPPQGANRRKRAFAIWFRIHEMAGCPRATEKCKCLAANKFDRVKRTWPPRGHCARLGRAPRNALDGGLPRFSLRFFGTLPMAARYKPIRYAFKSPPSREPVPCCALRRASACRIERFDRAVAAIWERLGPQGRPYPGQTKVAAGLGRCLLGRCSRRSPAPVGERGNDSR